MTVATPDPYAMAADLLAPLPEPHADDPARWVAARLGEHLWSRQREIAESVRDNRRTAVPSCHEAGKSFSASRIAAWWLETHAPGEAFVVSTAPTFRQVRAILWRELNRAHSKGGLRGRVNQTEWWIGNEIVAFGTSPSDYDPQAFQGIHARAVLVIIDEAAGVAGPIWDAADSLIANDESRILAIGNPDDPDSRFAEVCKPGSGWNVIAIDAFDTPNFTDEPVPDALRGLLISPTWVEEKRHQWGEESPLWKSKIRALFPDVSKDGVVPLAWITAAQAAWDDMSGPRPTKPVEMGVDVGAGGDESVIWVRRGAKPTKLTTAHTPDPMHLVGLILNEIRSSGAESVKIDVIGVGWGVAGRLEEMQTEGVHGARIVKVNVAEASSDSSRFPKLRDQLWWEVGREKTREALWDLRDVDDETLGQLIAPKYTIDSQGRVKIEPKDETIRRIGHSPDRADALLLAFYQPQKEHSWGAS